MIHVFGNNIAITHNTEGNNDPNESTNPIKE
jgi:hypothetical protein